MDNLGYVSLSTQTVRYMQAICRISLLDNEIFKLMGPFEGDMTAIQIR